jgi:phospholipid-binding lipoprotein MlaA
MRACGTAVLGFIVLLTAVGCSTAPVQEGPTVEPIFPASKVLDPRLKYADEVYDPWEGFNRSIYRFNYRFDKYVFLPAVNGYKAITPDVAEKGIHNFFNNLKDLVTLINTILQARPDKAAQTLTRIIWNTTLGLAGFIDVATALEVPRPEEDFGQTLGYWGVGNGPYLVLPIYGPSSLRDGIGLGVDLTLATVIRNQVVDLNTWQALAFGGLNAIDTRAHIPFRYYETGSAFEYDMVRWLYATKRELDIEK